jgi:hypothetical protein
MIEETLYSTLTADSTVNGIVAGRVYPVKLPQNATLEAITFSHISGPRDVSLAGASGTARARLRIDCWAERYREAKVLMAAVRGALDAVSGALAATGEIDFYDDEAEVYRTSIDYYFHHAEA